MDPFAKLAFVSSSPILVKEHDRQGWLNLFASEASIEDPVGSGTHKKQNGAAGAFYDTFIAPNDIDFRVQRDFVSGNEVARDVMIDTTSSEGLHISVPAHLRYRLTDEDGAQRLESLHAHWEIRPMLGKALKSGLPGIRTLLATTARMLKNQGLKSTLSYARGLVSGVFGRGRKEAFRFMHAVLNKDSISLQKQFHDGQPRIELVTGQHLSPQSFLSSIGKIDRVVMGEPISSGYTTSFRYSMKGDNGSFEGMAFLEFDRRTKKITAAGFLINELS